MNGSFKVGEWLVEPQINTLTNGDTAKRVEPRMMQVLVCLAEHAPDVVPREKLIRQVWREIHVTNDVLMHAISELRKAFGDDSKNPQYIQTIPKSGYRLIATVVPIKPEPEPIPKPKPKRRWRTQILAALLVLLAVVVAAVNWWIWIRKPPKPPQIETVRSIAVLPFKPLVADSRDETFELGMADTLIVKLSSIKEIIVRPISSVRKYTAIDRNPVAIGRELGVDAVLDGSIQTSGERVRISARLLRISDGSTLWAYQCDEQQCADIFLMQDMIAQKIAIALKSSLAPEELRLVSKHYTENHQAFQNYTIGRSVYNKWTPEGVKTSLKYYQKAIDIDPNYALAYSGIADAYNSLVSYGEPAKEVGPKAKAAAKKAIEVDATLAEAHASLGKAMFLYDWDWAGAEQELKLAIELKPNLAEAHSAYGVLLSVIGRLNEAIKEARQGQELDPTSQFVNQRVEFRLYLARQYDEAIEQCRKMLDIDPNYRRAHYHLATIYLLKERNDEAVAEFELANEVPGSDPQLSMERIKAYKTGGMRGYLHRRLDQVIGKTKPGFEFGLSGASDFAIIYSFLGEKDQALQWLQKAYDERDNGLAYLKVEPFYDNLRDDPRFTDLLRRVGLSE